MDPSTSVLSDDDYDVISNPSQRSLESSVADLSESRERSSEVHEPVASPAAEEKFETPKWTASEIQTFIRRTLDDSLLRLGPNTIRNKSFENRTVRIYVDGTFDMFNVGHALQLRQAKLSFPSVYLQVGVFSDEVLEHHGQTSSWLAVERGEMIRHCRWVDEVVADAPWELTEEFIQHRRIDFIAIDEGTSVDPECDKTRLKGYDEMKKLGKVITTRRTMGLTRALPRTTITAPPTPTVLTLETPAQEFTSHIQDDFF